MSLSETVVVSKTDAAIGRCSVLVNAVGIWIASLQRDGLTLLRLAHPERICRGLAAAIGELSTPMSCSQEPASVTHSDVHKHHASL